MNFYVFLSLALVAFVSATPVKHMGHQDDVDVMIVPLEAQLYDVEDPDSGFPGGFFSFNPFGNPFSGFMQSMDDMLRSLREQMTQVLTRLPAENTDWKEIGDGKRNSTSTTKVINGHKVTINETTYANEGDNSGAFFKIRVVDVQPASEEDSDNSNEKTTKSPNLSNDSEEKTTNASENKDVEEFTTKDSIEDIEKGSPEIQESANEIPRGKPEEQNSVESEIETLGEDFDADVLPDESFQNIKISSPEIITADIDDFAVPVKEIESNDVNSHIYDLSNDILVNQIQADAGAPHDPDAELIDVFNINDQPEDRPYSTQRIVPLLRTPSYPYPMWPVYYENIRP